MAARVTEIFGKISRTMYLFSSVVLRSKPNVTKKMIDYEFE